MSRNDVILGAVAAILVVFSLVVSIVIPRRDPGFPGKNLPAFVAVSVVLVLAVLASVELLGETHAGAENEAAHETTEGEGTGTGETDEGGGGEGDAAAGEAVFASAGCGSCHVLEEAGTSGAVGPNLDDSTMPLDAVVTQIAEGGGGMPPFSGQLSEQEIQDVAAFVVASQG